MKWLTCNFSLQQPYIIQQRSDENTQTYQVEVAILILRQILVTNFKANIKQIEGRINNQILGINGVKGWSCWDCLIFICVTI